MKNVLRFAAMTLVVAWASAAWAQSAHISVSARAWASNVIVPQARSMAVDHSKRVEIVGVKLDVNILEQAAITVMEIELQNPTSARIEAELLVPVPEGASIKGFTFDGAAKEPTAELLPHDKALSTYKSIVASMRDPAMLEFAGCNLVRSSVFPVEPRGKQKIRLTYEHLLPIDGNRVDYILPRTESLEYKVPWTATVKIQAKRPIATVYSSSHRYEMTRVNDTTCTLKIDKGAMNEPGPLQLSYLEEGEQGVTSSLFAYPDPKSGGGYFLLLAGVPAKARTDDGKALQRELTLVIDRSGSMSGQKIGQVKAAALQIVEGLEDGECFNIIDYSDSVASMSSKPVAKDKATMKEAREYIRKIEASGGTNLHDAVLEALSPKPKEGLLPIVLFLTDGLPTVGVKDERRIREDATAANKFHRRIFTFGVGYDVNAPLLTNLAQTTRATGTFVLPNEDVEAKVSQVFRRLKGPVLDSPKLAVVDKTGEPVSHPRVSDLMPGALPDLFEGDQLVVLGKYKDEQPIRFRLSGQFNGGTRDFTYSFNLDKATTRNNFVPRLWASRKIAMLIEEIRQNGADIASNPALAHASPPTDPKLKELVDEIVRLSLEFGILTEYTAFLAREGTDLGRMEDLSKNTTYNLQQRAQMTRTGIGAVNQSVNNDLQVRQDARNGRNAYFDENMKQQEIRSVQQVNDRAMFRQKDMWVDSQSINNNGAKVDQTVQLGTPEYDTLLTRLVRENRNGSIAVGQEVLINVDGKNVLVKNEPVASKE